MTRRKGTVPKVGKTAKAPGRRLKVFQAQFGFHDSVVAAPSQAAALRAWPSVNRFWWMPQARVTDDPQAVEAALAHPEVPLRRAVGSKDAFAVEPSSLPSVPDAPKRAAKAPSPKAQPERPAKPAADRAPLDAAEAALKTFDEARKREEAGLRKRQEQLDDDKEAAQAAYVQDRKAATAAVVESRKAYRAAGGED